MDKKLPSIFKNANTKPINNNKRVYYSLDKDDRKYNEESHIKEFVFNTPVIIETYSEVINTKIVSKIKDHILTYDNRIIKLNEIKSIKRKVS